MGTGRVSLVSAPQFGSASILEDLKVDGGLWDTLGYKVLEFYR